MTIITGRALIKGTSLKVPRRLLTTSSAMDQCFYEWAAALFVSHARGSAIHTPADNFTHQQLVAVTYQET